MAIKMIKFIKAEKLRSPTRNQAEILRFLSITFSSYYLIKLLLLHNLYILILSSSSLKLLTRKSGKTPLLDILSTGLSTVLLDFGSSVLPAKLKKNTLIKSFVKQNLSISDVYIKLWFRRFPPLQNLRTKRFFGRDARLALTTQAAHFSCILFFFPAS